MTVRSRANLAAIVLAVPVLFWLDGWLGFGAWRATHDVHAPDPVTRALRDVASDLQRRAAALAADPEVARSMQGGGIALRRQALFNAAREAMTGAAPGTWIALADRDGDVHAWWGDAPSQVLEARTAASLSVRWSATRLELLHWRVAGSGALAGLVCAARSLPVEAPDFGRALGLSGEGLDWEPVAPGKGPPLLTEGAEAIVAARRTSEPVGPEAAWRAAALAFLLAVTLLLLSGRADPRWMGVGLALGLLGALCFVDAGGDRSLLFPEVWIPALGAALLPLAFDRMRRRAEHGGSWLLVAAAYAAFALAFFGATRVALPDLGSRLPILSAAFLEVLGLTALVVAALALGAAAAAPASRARIGTALFVTAGAIVAALAGVSAAPLYPFAVGLAAVVCFAVCRRAIGAAPVGMATEVFRLLAAALLLFVLIASPIHEHRRAAEAFRSAAAIRLPDPDRISAGAVVAVRRAVERIEAFDLARELPAPVASVDLSDLAYRLWREGETKAPSSALIAYEVLDRAGLLRSRFSLIPETETANAYTSQGGIRIERHEVAVVRRAATLTEGGSPWGRVVVSVADWPGWDPLPPRLEVYRRLVGAEPASASPPRPVLASYGADGTKREEGPDFPASILARVREAGRPLAVRLRYRNQELRGELRPVTDGFQLVAIPGPDFLQRILTAARLLPPAAAVSIAFGFVLIWRVLTSRRRLRDWIPMGAQTFRGRLVALFVLSVMIPLLAVTAYLRASIQSRTGQDTLDHARTGLETAQRVLDDYLPSVSAPGRINLLDDALLAWLANAVGYDLSIFSSEARLVATSRRDLYAAGLLPERVSGPAYAAIGLGGARQRTDVRLLEGTSFEEMTTALASVPGVPGVRSPVLLALLLLPQQRIAEEDAAQLTAAFSAFSLLVFLVSAAVAGRLAVRVARPVADLVEGTRAVARGDFAPQLVEPPDAELRELVRAFLSMSRDLKERTDALSREKERLATLLAQLTAGVVAYGEDRRVLLANPAAAALGGGGPDGATLDEVFPGEAMQPVREVLARFAPEPQAVDLEPRPGERWRIVTVPLPLGGAGARMAVIEDVSDVVRSNRLAAWAEMAQIIAHEIKNPLTPIRLSVEHLREVWRRGSPDFDRVLEDCVRNVLRQTDELRRSAAEFSDYARLPEPRMRPTDVGALLRESVAAYAGAAGVRWTVDAADGLYANGDPRLLARVLSNLIGNSVEALGNGGGGAIRVSAGRRGDRVLVAVEDDGPGVTAAILPRLFDPYFSAKSGGTGLGLAIAKKIVEEHGGTIGAENRKEKEGGLRVAFDLPVSGGGAGA